MSYQVDSYARSWSRARAFDRFRANSLMLSGTIHSAAAERAKDIINTMSRGSVPEYFPAQIQINLTSACTRKKHHPGDCANCSFPAVDADQVNPVELLKALRLFTAYGGRSIFLSGGGEPGSYEHLEVLLTFLADDPDGQQLELTLNTNGTYIHQIANLAKQPGRNGLEWRKRLQRIYSPMRGGIDVLSIVSISWHDDDQGMNAVRLLASLRTELRLHLVIRVSSLVYGEYEVPEFSTQSLRGLVGGNRFSTSTSVAQAQAIAKLAEESGADIICYKPAHFNFGGIRQHLQNQPVYEYVAYEIDQQDEAARASNWVWDNCNGSPQFDIIFEQSDRLSRLKNIYKEALHILVKQELFCIAPFAMLFLTPQGVAACCDTWALGLGSLPLIINEEIEPPHLYYPHILSSMLQQFPNHWPKNCVLGCGWTEFNLSNPLSKCLKSYNRNTSVQNCNDNKLVNYLCHINAVL